MHFSVSHFHEGKEKNSVAAVHKEKKPLLAVHHMSNTPEGRRTER